MIIDVVGLNLEKLNFHKPYDTARMMRAKTIYRNEDVEITKVEKIDEENFEVSAKVEGSYIERYNVELSIRKEYVEEYSCTCEDFRKGYICKHILATTMETINPHEPSTEEGRDKLLENNKDEDIKIFLISLKAGGTGLNLTGADVVIHYDPWWNVSIENQATDRAYRIGQKNSVQVYKLITTNSIEEKINKLQEKKQNF